MPSAFTMSGGTLGTLGAAGDLGLGDMLSNQRIDETEEERKRRLLGLSQNKGSAAAQQLFGMTGVQPVAPLSLGLGGVRRI